MKGGNDFAFDIDTFMDALDRGDLNTIETVFSSIEQAVTDGKVILLQRVTSTGKVNKVREIRNYSEFIKWRTEIDKLIEKSKF